jgi:hypothetical protein
MGPEGRKESGLHPRCVVSAHHEWNSWPFGHLLQPLLPLPDTLLLFQPWVTLWIWLLPISLPRKPCCSGRLQREKWRTTSLFSHTLQVSVCRPRHRQVRTVGTEIIDQYRSEEKKHFSHLRDRLEISVLQLNYKPLRISPNSANYPLHKLAKMNL